MMSNFLRRCVVSSCVIVSAFSALSANAQKAKDTLRIVAVDTYSVLSPYDVSVDLGVYYDIYSPLLTVNENTGQYVPELATSWRTPTPSTIEFDLREGVQLHSGKQFNADDIIAAVNYTIDPKTKIRGKSRYTWVKNVEKLGPYKIRVHMADRQALGVYAFSKRFYVEDSDILGSLENKEDYGRVSAASAGPYKLISMDRNKGAVLERFEKLHPALTYRRAPTKRIEVLQIPDVQTRIANLLTGQVDVLRDLTDETVEALASKPGIAVTEMPSSQFIYMTLDGLGRSGRKEFTDVRVRKAMVMAIDRDKIAKEVVPGGDVAEILNTLCFDHTAACSYTSKPYAYDPAAAKKLLVEAGYETGFDLTIYVHAPVKDVAVAISGYLRKVGIRASVQSLPISVYTQYRDDGKLMAFVGSRPTADFPETTEILDSFFTGSRDYWADQDIQRMMAEAVNISDEKERGRVLRPALDRINELAYMVPFSSQPWVFAHSKDVRVEPNLLKVGSVYISDFFWK
jgi:peptide/nickel transport system substrate-binding protein